MKNFLLMKFLPRSADIGLLALRLLLGTSLFLKHGWEKIAHFSMMSAHFQDPIHIGPVPSFIFAFICDAICSVLVFLGFATRWAALIAVVNIGVAWSLVHHFTYFAKPQGDHGEVCVLYICVFLAIFLAGAGRYSLDGLIDKGSVRHRGRETQEHPI